MKIYISSTGAYKAPSKTITADTQNIGMLYPFGNNIIFLNGGHFMVLNDVFSNKNLELYFLVQDIRKFCCIHGYKALYISNGSLGVRRLRTDYFWKRIGFIEDDNPDLLVLYL